MDPLLPEVLKAVGGIITACGLVIGGLKLGERRERKRPDVLERALATAKARVDREVLLDEGENGNATLRRMVRSGLEDLSAAMRVLERSMRDVREDVRGIWRAVDDGAASLRTHEADEDHAIGELRRDVGACRSAITAVSQRLNELAPEPPPGQPERRRLLRVKRIVADDSGGPEAA